VMDTTALYSAACSIAKLRVGCTEPGWAFGVPTIVISARFHWATDCPDPAASAIPAAAAAGAGGPPEVWVSTGIAIPAATTAAVAVTSTVVVLRMGCPCRSCRVGARSPHAGRLELPWRAPTNTTGDAAVFTIKALRTPGPPL
jgi:hypothetical protein